MSRDITSQANDAANSEIVRPALMVFLDYQLQPVYANSTPYTLSFDGNDYLGVGNLGDISAIQEGSKTQAYGVGLKLSGVPASLISIALADHYQGRDAKIFLAMLDSEHQMIADPTILFHGRIDTMDIELGETAVISVTAESRLADLQRPRVRRYTHEDQQHVFPDDRGLEFVAEISDKEIIWGKA